MIVIKKFYDISNEKENDNNESLIESNIYDFLKDFKFITYYIIENQKYNDLSKNTALHPIDVVFCIEKKCLIIEHIEVLNVKNIINNLKILQISIINANRNPIIFQKDSKEEALEEIQKFCSSYYSEINNNQFVKKTIYPIAGYIIRRHFYPTNYFEDQSFFHFYSTEENNYQTNLQDFFFSNKDMESIDNLSLTNESQKEICLKEFKETDFISLRSVFTNENYFFELVIHIESFYIFLMKKVQCKEKINNNPIFRKEFEHEI